MDEPYQFAYLFWAFYFGFFWLLFYLLKPSVRREMLILSVVTGVLGPLGAFFYTQDYWQPSTLFGSQIGIEDALVGFFYGGVAASLYEIFFFNQPNRSHKPGSIPLSLMAVVGGAFLMYLGVFVFHINSLYVSLAVLFIPGIAMTFYRPRLWKHAFVTGILFTAFSFIYFQVFIALFPGIIESWWRLSHISGSLIAGVPLEEILFAFAWGFAVGPASELAARLKPRL